MSNRILGFSLSLCVGGAVLAAGACSSRDGFDSSGPTFVSPDAEASAPVTPDSQACGPHCSRDLKSVLTGCEGAETVVMTCNADQGCGQDQCVDACTAATLSKGSAGCDFYTLPVDDINQGPASCFAAFVANTWDRAVALNAEYAGKTLDISKSIYTVDRPDAGDPVYTALTGSLEVGQVAVVFLAQGNVQTGSFDGAGTLCPKTVTPALLADPIIHGSGLTSAFHLHADAPVSAYSIFPYGGAATHFPSATLLLPVGSWDTDYLAVSPHDFGHPSLRTLQIVAQDDATEVSIRPNAEIPAGSNTAGATAGVTQTWTLAKGQVLQLTQSELTGSPISATKPIGVFGGSQCTYIPSAFLACDLLHQQIAPTSQWGTEYALVPYPSRIDTLGGVNAPENVPYTLVGAADGTILTYEPSRPLGAPATLDAGQQVSFMTDQMLVVHTQDSKHPIYASVYMTGADYGGGAADDTTMVIGDPDFVNIPPTDQFLDHYVFFTDYTYADTRLTIVRRKTTAGFSDVTLDCAGVVTGFQPLGTSGELEYAFVALTKGFIPQTFPGGTCSYGRQAASSDGPFAITVWGMDQASSYGYVGGTGLRPINDAPKPVLK